MANDNVIDQLSLQIDANASAAIKNLSQMQRQLRNLAKDIGSVSASSKSLGSLTTAFRSVNKINIGNLRSAVSELERLSKVDLKNLNGKKITMDINIRGASEAERQIAAIQKAFNSIDSKKYADRIAKAFGITDKGSIKQIREEVSGLARQIADTGKIQPHAAKGLGEIIKKDGQVAKGYFDEYTQSMMGRYNEFLAYIEKKPFVVSRATYDEMLRESSEVFKQGLGRYFTTDSTKSGRDTNGMWAELTNSVHGYGDVMDSVNTKSDYMAASLSNETDQAERLAQVILAVKDAVSTIDMSKLTDAQQKMALGGEHGATPILKSLQEDMQNEIRNNMADSIGKIPLQVLIDETSVETQLQRAINSASQKKYEMPLKFTFGEMEKNIKNTIASSIAGVDVGKLGDFSEKMKEVATAMAQIGNSTPKQNGVNSFVNSIKRLTEADMSKFNVEAFHSIITTTQELAGIKDISAQVTKLVNSLAKLASAGSGRSIAQSSMALPRLGNALREVMVGITSAGALPAELNAFVSALAQLANAGNKTGQTSQQLEGLGKAIKDLMTSLQSAPSISADVLSMVQSLGQLANAGGKTGKAVESMQKSIGGDVSSRLSAIKNIITDLGSAFSKASGLIRQGASKIVSSLQNIRTTGLSLNSATNSIKNMIGAMIGFRGVTGLVNLGKQMLTLGGDITEIDHIVESVFGDMAGAVDKWADDAISKFGIASHSAKQYAGVLSSMFQASGIGRMDAGKMGMDLTGLAGDLSAFYNIDTETAFKKVQSGMAGMVRPLRDLGIDLTAATLSEYALSQGIAKSYTEMSQAEKVMLRYNYLMEVTNQQQGDFALTSKSFANSLRTLKANFAALGTQIGSGLTAAIRPAIVWLNELMKYLVKGAAAFATFMKTLFPFKNGSKGFAFDATGMEENVADVGDAASGIAGGLDDADESAKKLKKDLAVLPFDELNQLTKDRESTSSNKGSDDGSGLDNLGGLGDGLLDWGDMLDGDAGKLPEKVSEWAKRVKAAFEEGNWDKLGEELAWGINEGVRKIYDALDFNKFKEKVDPFITGFTQTFNSLIRNVDWNLIGKTVGQGINNIVYAVNRLLTEINWTQIGKSFADFANGLVNKVNFAEIGKMFGNKFMVLWRTLYGFAQDFDWVKFGKKLGAGINGLNSAISWTTVSKAMATSINGLFTTLSNFTKTVKWEDIAKNITNGINTFIKNFKWEENGKALGDFIGNLCDTLISIIEKTNWDEFGKGLAKMLQKIPWHKILEVVGKAIVKGLGGILKGLASTPAGLLANAFIASLVAFKIGSKLFPFANAIVTAIAGKGISTLLAGKAASLMMTFKGAVTSALPSIGAAISGGFSTIISGVGSVATAIGGALAAITPVGWITIGVIAGVAALTVAVVTHWDDIKQAAGKMWEGIKKAWNSIKDHTKNTFSKVKEHIDNIWKKIDLGKVADTAKTKVTTAWNAIKDTTKSAFDAVKSKVDDVWGKIDTKVGNAATNAFNKANTAWSNIKAKTSEVFGGVRDSVVSAFQNVSTKINEVAPNASRVINSNWKNIKSVTTNTFDSISQKATRVWNDVKRAVDTSINSVTSKLGGSFESAASKFKSSLDSISEKASKKFETIKSKVGEAFSSLKSTFGTKWSLDISNSKPHIPVPHFRKSGSFSLNPPSIPHYEFAGWWKKGGLFKGGSGQLIGVAEGGRDEAVLPLENSKAMATIGSAIANASSGGLGISKDDIVDAVVTAMAMNPQSQEIIVNAVLKMENDEVLARHVERGRQRLDSRYNPVAQY